MMRGPVAEYSALSLLRLLLARVLASITSHSFIAGLLLLLLAAASPPGVQAVENCTVVQNKCIQRLGCGMALQNYFINCGELIHGETGHCSSQCKKALISLLSTEDHGGEAFMTCDCQGVQICERQRERLSVCTHQVMNAMKSVKDGETRIPCTLAQWICNADTLCFTALEYYHQHCRKLIRGEKCTRRCNNSLSILYRQTKAHKLRTCVCDGTEEYNCPELRTNTDEMCFGIKPHVRHPSHKNHTRPTASPPPGGGENPPHRLPDPRDDDGKNTSGAPPSRENDLGYDVRKGYNVSSAPRDCKRSAVALTLLLPLLTLLTTS